ncbi:hypothetical protein [Pseudactinotalea suaedae]|uniref:hypothetical protein n=1 Tax=Pseudactinotalea suaedae TaxID=1524924 RepID=UPI0012E1ED0C|nr:hypothetical protein [Pseudactinotalea suaedae]
MRERSSDQATVLGDQARHALHVEGPPWARRTADVASGLAILSLLAGLWFGPVAIALVALVLLGVVVVRLAPLPGQLQALTLCSLVGSAWAALLGGYQQIPWLDVVAHTVITGMLAAVATTLLTGPPLRPHGAGRALDRSVDVVLVTTGLGSLLAVIWEIAEWVGHVYVDPAVFVSYDDTIGDLAAGLLGSVLAGLLLARFVRTRTRGPGR